VLRLRRSRGQLAAGRETRSGRPTCTRDPTGKRRTCSRRLVEACKQQACPDHDRLWWSDACSAAVSSRSGEPSTCANHPYHPPAPSSAADAGSHGLEAYSNARACSHRLEAYSNAWWK
jgi:hypothetical protein